MTVAAGQLRLSTRKFEARQERTGSGPSSTPTRPDNLKPSVRPVLDGNAIAVARHRRAVAIVVPRHAHIVAKGVGCLVGNGVVVSPFHRDGFGANTEVSEQVHSRPGRLSPLNGDAMIVILVIVLIVLAIAGYGGRGRWWR